MKQYVVDELRPGDFEKIESYLKERFEYSGLENLYWVRLDEKILTDVQASHTQCAPFYFAIELEPGRMSCELLVRTRQRIKCDCMNYADQAQRDWFIGLADTIIEQLAIKV